MSDPPRRKKKRESIKALFRPLLGKSRFAIDKPGGPYSPELVTSAPQSAGSPSFDTRPDENLEDGSQTLSQDGPLVGKNQQASTQEPAGDSITVSQIPGQRVHHTATAADALATSTPASSAQTTTVNISGGKFYQADNIAIHNTSNTHSVHVHSSTQEERLHVRLQPSVRADYKYGLTSGEKQKVSRDICTPGTRKNVIEDIIKWVEDDSDTLNNLFLLCGPAGSGKSTIAYTVAHLFDPKTKDHVKASMKLDQYPKQKVNLAANFFCSRHFEETSRISAIAPTIAYQYAIKHKPFADTLQDFEALHHGVQSQLEYLLSTWGLASAQQSPDGQLVIIIEAIDELGVEDSHRFLESLIKCLENDPPRGLKFIVTSREEGGLIKLTDSLPQKRLYRLQEVDKAEVEDDIRTYLTASLPDAEDGEREKAVVYSDGLFICAATIVRYLEPYRKTPMLRNIKLRTLMAKLSESTQGLDAMDDIYRKILHEALHELQEDTDLLSDYLSMLHTFLCTFVPTSPATAAMLANTSYDTKRIALLSEIAGDLLRRLHAVLYCDGEGGVLPYHKSFLDFVFDRRRADQYHCDRESFNSRITTSCFRIMHRELRFNIAGIDTSYCLDEAIPDLSKRVAANISPSLAYASHYWSHHLNSTQAATRSPFHDSLYDFLEIKALFWIELMNLLGHQALCDDLLRKARDWVLRSSPLRPNSSLAQKLFEAASFALFFAASLASASTPHLYISALASWPSYNDLPSTWRRRFFTLPYLEYRGEHNPTLVEIDVGSMVYATAISNDGSRIASGSENGMVQIWDATTGKQAVKLEGHTGEVTSVAFSNDGTRVASGSRDHTVRIWDVSTWKLVVNLEGHTSSVNAIAFSGVGTYVVSGSSDQSVRVWDLSMGGLEINKEEQPSSVTSVAFSSDGTHVASGSNDNSVRMWSLSPGKWLLNTLTLEGHTHLITSLAFSNNGTHVASSALDNETRIWDVSTGKLVIKLTGNTSYGVNSVAFSSNGSLIATGAGDKFVRIWDLSTGNLLVKLEGHTSEVTSVAFSNDGTRVLSGSWDHSVRIWAVSTGKLAIKQESHTHGVDSVAFLTNENHVISSSNDQSARIWDVRTGETVVTMRWPWSRGASSAAFSSDGSLVASGTYDRSVHIWDVWTGRLVVKLEGHTNVPTSFAFSSNATTVAAGSYDNTVRIWDVSTAKLLVTLEGHTSWVRSVAFSNDGTRLVSGSHDTSARIWDVVTGKLAVKLVGHSNWVVSVAFSPDATRVVSGSNDNSVRIWDSLTGEMVSKLEGHTAMVYSVVFSRNGDLVVSGSSDRSVRIWDVSRGELVVKLEGHTDRVESVAISSDGTRLASGSADKSVRIWNLEHIVPPYILERFPSTSTPTGWLLSPDTSQHHLMYVSPSARLIAYPAILCISPAPHSVLSPFNYDCLGENWTKCYRTGLFASF